MREFITKKCSLTLRITVFKRMSLCGGLPCSQSRAACGSVRIAADFSEQQPAASPSGQKHDNPVIARKAGNDGVIVYAHHAETRAGRLVDSPRLYSRRASHPQKTAPQARTPSRPLFIHQENIFPAYRPP